MSFFCAIFWICSFIDSYLNDKSDEFLEAHNYGRDEIKAGLKDITVRYGVDGFAEMFLQ